MSKKDKSKGSDYREASTLLEAALAQLAQVDRALAVHPSDALNAAAGRAKEAVSRIRSAMSSGTLDAAALVSLSADLNIGVDASALATTETQMAARVNVTLAAASLESHLTVERLSDEIFKKHVFDADIERHTHGAELEAFRRRQAEDEKYIHDQLARGTAEGDLNASGRMEGHMLRANAHGAGDNPQFMSKWNDLRAKTDKLRASMQAAGLSTEEYDRQIRQDVVDFLKSKGLSDQQIQQALVGKENPLDAVQPYLGADKDSQGRANRLRETTQTEGTGPTVEVAPENKNQPPTTTLDLGGIDGRLAARGWTATASSDEATGHGLTIQKPIPNVNLIGH